MADKIILKNSSEAGKVPQPADLDIGELAVNASDGKVFTKKSDGTVTELSGAPSSGSSGDQLYTEGTWPKQTTTTTGTIEEIALDGQVAGFETFSTQLDDGDKITYRIEEGDQWEHGVGNLTVIPGGSTEWRFTFKGKTGYSDGYLTEIKFFDADYNQLYAVSAQSPTLLDVDRLVDGDDHMFEVHIDSFPSEATLIFAEPTNPEYYKLIDGYYYEGITDWTLEAKDPDGNWVLVDDRIAQPLDDGMRDLYPQTPYVAEGSATLNRETIIKSTNEDGRIDLQGAAEVSVAILPETAVTNNPPAIPWVTEWSRGQLISNDKNNNLYINPPGSDGQVLTYSSSYWGGLRWKTPNLYYTGIKLGGINTDPYATAWGAIAIGDNAKATKADCIAIGTNSISADNSLATNCIAIGNTAKADKISCMAIGTNSRTWPGSTEGIAIGTDALTEQSYGISIGTLANSTSTSGVAIGRNSETHSGVALGNSSRSTGGLNTSIAIGTSASASGTWSVAIGDQSDAYRPLGISLGYRATATGENAIAIGEAVNYNTPIGDGLESIMIGNNLDCSEDYQIMIKNMNRGIEITGQSCKLTNAHYVDTPYATASRPTAVEVGSCIFDTDLNKPIWYTGSAWVDSSGTTV